MEHLSSDQLGKLREGLLSGVELLAAEDHMANCEECRQQCSGVSAAASSWAELALGMRVAAQTAEPHVSYESLQAYVDGGISQAEKMRLESHLLVCEDCRNEASDLQEFAATLPARPGRPVLDKRYWVVGLAAAALLAGVLLMRPREQPAPLVASLRDSGKIIGLDRQGRLVGAHVPALLSALRDGTIAVAIPPGLLGEQSVLRGAPASARNFQVLNPVGEVVLQDPPEFRWQALDRARYRVQIFDADYHLVASSPQIADTFWTPGRPLGRGKTYVWKVTAIGAGAPIQAPQPTEPEARFQIVTSGEAESIDRARQASEGHLQMAVEFASAGLCRDALGEMDALERENTESALVQRIRASIATKCGASQH